MATELAVALTGPHELGQPAVRASLTRLNEPKELAHVVTQACLGAGCPQAEGVAKFPPDGRYAL